MKTSSDATSDSSSVMMTTRMPFSRSVVKRKNSPAAKAMKEMGLE